MTSRFAKYLRLTRSYHRYFGLTLALLLFVSAGTGLLLGWKKDADWIQPPTMKGQSSDMAEWKPVNELCDIAIAALRESHPEIASPAVDRLDLRPSKGIVKVQFEQGWWEVQVDGSTGEVLSIARRHSDWIEALHDGSLVSDAFKLISMNVLGLGLIILISSGFLLWYGPRVYRRWRRRR